MNVTFSEFVMGLDKEKRRRSKVRAEAVGGYIHQRRTAALKKRAAEMKRGRR